jgi:hypothetical protein
VERDLDVQRLAVGYPLVRLEPVAEAAVGVAVAAQRVQRAVGVGLLEEHAEDPALQQPPFGVEETAGVIETWLTHDPGLPCPRGRGLERFGHRARSDRR